ncbi:ABC transporter permease [Saxibacter everestensis]|uniref:ABC transporter permease n=1 Tax=Saxibacter everestensis TaxID=2909229 RepID=A0ABY8QT11_9MICO|nr:ABC transporter permease [Brevibacteriaceae bacterium ZFBP1038]
MTGFMAALVEAWQELRIHKLRVLLSLIGVAVAVCALTTVVALGNIAEQASIEAQERSSGRPALFSITMFNDSGETTADFQEVRLKIGDVMDRHGISYSSPAALTTVGARTPSGKQSIDMTIVDQPYADMHRVSATQGRWFTRADGELYGPAIVVDQKFLDAMGVERLDQARSVTLAGDRDVKATIVGVIDGDPYTEAPTGYILSDSYQRWFSSVESTVEPSWEMWVPLDNAEELGTSVQGELQKQMPGWSVDVSRQDYLTWGGDDGLGVIKTVLAGISVLVLLLGALSLLNVALVTIKQRVREIGIRRSFGATSGRVFFSVMMESVVATLAAGVAGVIASIAVVNSSLVRNFIGEGVVDLPPFPLWAAGVGLGTSLFVGALAGLLPALVAVRVKIIDAIRF